MTAVEQSTASGSDPRRALSATGLLAGFNDAGLLAAADVHVAQRLDRLGAEPNAPGALLACALAVRAPRLGHVCVDLATIAGTVTTEADAALDPAALPWPEPDGWLEVVRASPLVGAPDGPYDRPLRLAGSRLYLDRYWREEAAVAADLHDRAGPVEGVDHDVLQAGLLRLFGADAGTPDLQRLAAATAVLRRLTVIAGGPGTGKTTTVARVLALLVEQTAAGGRPPPRIALAAPTGKAAARLEEAVRAAARSMPIDSSTRERLEAVDGRTLHRLLGWRPGSSSRFRHHGGNRLPHDVVVVDETSMVSLSLMARLLEAVRHGARIVLVGDHQQLASVEAGAVLGDIVGPAGGIVPGAHVPAIPLPAAVEPGASALAAAGALAEGIVVLTKVHRHGGAIAALAAAVHAGDGDAAIDLLRAPTSKPALRFLEVDAQEPAASDALASVRAAIVASGARMVEAASAGRAADALRELSALRLLCAHRHGPYGVGLWSDRIEAWLAAAVPDYGAQGRWYPGRPVLVTANDYTLGLYNGDTGVVVAAGEGLRAVFSRRGTGLAVSPTRLSSAEAAHALTVHKSQGSQFAEVALLLPDESSPLLTRELLYTGLTRAQERLTVIGTEAAVRAAVRRRIARASGLGAALWGDPGGRPAGGRP